MKKTFSVSNIQVENAEKCGAAGVLLYSDPADYSPDGMDNTFPRTWWLPGTGTQRGTIGLVDGDPLTPGLPSIDGIYRINRNDTNAIPRIPAQVITYNDAVEFLKRLGGKVSCDSCKQRRGKQRGVHQIY